MAKLSLDQVQPLIGSERGNVANIARHLGVSRTAILKFVAKYPTLTQELKDARESMKDHAESALYKAIDTGEAWAVCFFLKTQGKDRGYVERQELTGADGEGVSVRFVENIIDQPRSIPAGGPAPEAATIPSVG